MTGHNHKLSDSAGNSADSDTTAQNIMKTDDNSDDSITSEEENARQLAEAAAIRDQMTALEASTGAHAETARATDDKLDKLEAEADKLEEDASDLDVDLTAEEKGAAAAAAETDNE